MWRRNSICWGLVFIFLCFGGKALPQHSYVPNSVLSNGSWFKLAVSAPGIYKVDLAFLAKLGINTAGLSSGSIRLYGNGGGMLPELPGASRIDDLHENPIWVEDGGDGVLNGSDYFLFYAAGPDGWLKDSAARSFHHRHNLFSDSSYYFISIGGNGKRIPTAPVLAGPTDTITMFDDRYAHELDTFNFLNSGKDWAGEEFSDIPGHTLSRQFDVHFPGATGSAGYFRIRCLARSLGTGSHFTIVADGGAGQQLQVPAVASGTYDIFVRSADAVVPFIATGPDIRLSLTYAPGSFNSQGWLDWFEAFVRRPLSMESEGSLLFRDWSSVGPGRKGLFRISNAPGGTQVWDVTSPLDPVRLPTATAGNGLEFINDCSRLHEYVAFSVGGYLQPVPEGPVPNQDLHNSSTTDYLIVAAPQLLGQAQRLAAYHQQKEGWHTALVSTTQVYNEFASGSPDPTAIRDFVKMYYDKAGGDSTKSPRYLLLFGDASFDYKDRLSPNSNEVPAYESAESYDPLSTYTSDDYFGLLDDGDDISGPGTYLLDIGIGRIPAGSESEAKSIVDKIVNYHDPANFGSWHNELTFVADDEDANLHLQDAEAVTRAVGATAPVFNLDKIYLDAYPQQSGAGGSRYPAVNQAISDRIFSGTLIWNYNGHGGYRRLAEEDILDQDIINGFHNAGKLPLFITATCDFAPYDNPLIHSIGEDLLLRPQTGAIALMTTTRLVFAFSNRVMNLNYLNTALQRKADGSYPSLGEAVRWAKNYTYTYSGDVINNRKFTLLGDPGLTLAYPVHQVRITAINGKPLTAVPDTLKALSQYSIEGELQDQAGNLLSSFNGTVFPEVFDKPQSKMTLGNDPGSIPVSFQVSDNLLFRGKATVSQGKFSFRFIVPKDISYSFGNGKLSFYAQNDQTDGNGMLENIIVGGTGKGVSDNQGPDIQAWLNDEKFVNGSITNETPILLLKLSDSSGINILGTGIGHDLQAMLDNDPQKVFVLNSFYEADLDNFRSGSVRFQLPAMEPGDHRLTIKAWDVANNSGEAILEFRVLRNENFTLDHVLNYPNPFTTHTTFWFEHNRPGEPLDVFIQVFTVSGKLVKTIRNTIFSAGNRSSEVSWDGRDEYGSKLARGVYIYRLKVKTEDGKSAVKWQKLYIL